MTKYFFIIVFPAVIILLFAGCVDIEDILDNRPTVQERAVKAGNPSLCKEASYPGTCMTAVAKSREDDSLCDGIPDVNQRNRCYAEVPDKSGRACGSLGENCCEGYDQEWGRSCFEMSTMCSGGKCVQCARRGEKCGGELQCCRGWKCISGVCRRDECGWNNKPCCEGNKCYFPGNYVCIDGTCRDIEDEGIDAEDAQRLMEQEEREGYSSALSSRG